MDFPRVIATDLDGTLLRSDGTLSDRTRRALDLAAAQGAYLIAVTARPIRWLDRLVPEFTTLPHVIASNGALCYDLATGTAYDLLPFPAETLPLLIAALKDAIPGAGIAVETPSGLSREDAYVPSPRDPDADDAGRRVGPIDELLDQPVVKLLAARRDRTSSDLFADASLVVGDTAHLTYSSNAGLLELGPPNVTKASTLAAWCAARGIAAHEVVAFGDMPNDLPMLDWAGRSYAVANAHPDVLATADGVTAGHNDDGVAAVLEELLDD